MFIFLSTNFKAIKDANLPISSFTSYIVGKYWIKKIIIIKNIIQEGRCLLIVILQNFTSFKREIVS